jgi:hypothetical protein
LSVGETQITSIELSAEVIEGSSETYTYDVPMSASLVRSDLTFPDGEASFFGDNFAVTVGDELYSITMISKGSYNDIPSFNNHICFQPRSEGGAPCNANSCDDRTTVNIANSNGGYDGDP